MLSEQKKGEKWFASGFVFVVLTLLPCLVLGDHAVYTYHDQLDGEMIAYLLQARHLGVGSVLPEFMGGAAKTALMPPAPACVLLFRILQPRNALYLMQLLGSLTGYAGMYLLVREKTGNRIAGAAAGVMYGLIPFLPVYGLSQYGLPLLFWCVLQLRQGKKGVFRGLLYGMIYAACSSLVLVGFAVLAVLAVWVIRRWLRNRKIPMRELGMCGIILLFYLAENMSLILQVLGVGERELSHKTEYVLQADSFFRGLLQGFLYGGQHSTDHHLGILGLAVTILILEGVRKYHGKTLAEKSGMPDPLCRVIGLCLECNLIFAAVSAFWNSGAGIVIRSRLGAVGAFQADRFLWLAPCLWYLVLGCCLAYGLQIFGRVKQGDEDRNYSKMRILAGSVLIISWCVACFSGLMLLKDSDIKSNLQKLRNPEYPMISYGDYYAIGVLDQVRDYLLQERGLLQDEYRVVSLGIDPAAAYYHGFYCLDGYSNNYALSYKHAFRQIIAPALAESEYLRAYFDDWGNRCYVFGTECPGYYTIEKNGFYFQHLELDSAALRKLGGKYLLSAAYIANSGEIGLTLMREEPFETPGSYYRIFLYEVTDENR